MKIRALVMKLNKLVLAMGIATATLMGCSDHENKTSVTAIDGYIVAGNVTATCNTNQYTATTNIKGVAIVDIVNQSLSNCTLKVVGDSDSYDYDQGSSSSWEYTMKSLQGLKVINPYTDIASTLSEDETNDGLSQSELMALVLDLLGTDATTIVGDFNLFSDFGASTTVSEQAQQVRVLAESTFAATIAITEALGSDDSAENRIAMFNAVLPVTTEAVYSAITSSSDLSTIVFVASVTIPTLVFEDGVVNTDDIATDMSVSITEEDKPEPIDPVATGTGTGTGGDDTNQG